MKRRKIPAIVLSVLAVLSVVGLIGYRFYRAHATGGAGPVIEFQSEVIEVTTDASDAELLQGVTATDAEDGDVSDTVIVEAVTRFVSANTAEVTYAAFDSNGHVTKAMRSVRYVDYTPPRFTLSGPMIFSESGVSELLSFVGATDCMDGDISTRVKISAQENGTLISTPGTHILEFRVTNSMGDTAYLNVPVEVESGFSAARVLPLTAYLVYIPQGSEFDPRAYLTEDFADVRGLEIDSTVDTATPGTYSVAYRLNAQQSRLIVVVE